MSLPTTTAAEDCEGVIGFALRELSNGAHPLSYLSTAKLSLEAHAARYAKDEAYRSIVNAAITDCLGFWKTYVNARLISFNDDVIDVREDDSMTYYERLCIKEAQRTRATHNASFSKKTDWKALFDHIDDIEHYAYKLAPHLDPLSKRSDIDILERAEERAFTITIVDSKTPKDEDDV